MIVAALVVAIWPRGGDDGETGDAYADRFSGDRPVPTATGDPVSSEARAAADLAECPDPSGAPAPAGSPLAGITLDCLADGTPVDVASALAGRPALLNIWAHWCAPCAEELPYLEQYAERAGEAITVLTVHTDPAEQAALERLTEYGVRLPGVQDAAGRIRAAVGAPPVMPVSVLIDADGSVAAILPQPFDSVDEIESVVNERLGTP